MTACTGTAVRAAGAAAMFALVLLGASGCGRGSGATRPTVEHLALGDSIAWDFSPEAYALKVAQNAEEDLDKPVHSSIRGFGGWTSAQLVGAVENYDNVRSAIEAAHYITLNIGFNDFYFARGRHKAGGCGGDDNQACLRESVRLFREKWDELLDELLAMTSSRPGVMISAMDVYNPFVAEDRADGSNGVLEPYLQAINEHIHEAAAARGIAVARVYDGFNGDGADPVAAGLINPDGIHPSAAGTTRIAELIRQLGYGDLARREAGD